VGIREKTLSPPYRESVICVSRQRERGGERERERKRERGEREREKGGCCSDSQPAYSHKINKFQANNRCQSIFIYPNK